MMHVSKARLHARIALLAIVVASAAPAGAADQIRIEFTDRDNVILECMYNGTSSMKCKSRTPYEFDPKYSPKDDWMHPWRNWDNTKFFPLPALTGPSIAELYRRHLNQNDHRYGAIPQAPSSKY